MDRSQRAAPSVARLTVPGRRSPLRVRTCDARTAHVSLRPSLGEYPVHDERAYRFMLEDERRNGRYAVALRTHAPGRTVPDIGTGWPRSGR